MKIFHLKNRLMIKPKQYRECIIIAENELKARQLSVQRFCKFDDEKWPINIDLISCICIGNAFEGDKERVVIIHYLN